MFMRETTADGKISYWTIPPEANRCLTLDQVYKVCVMSLDLIPKIHKLRVCPSDSLCLLKILQICLIC